MKTPMNIDTELEQLKKVKMVEAPPFLFTRIERRIAEAAAARVQPGLRFVVISSLIVLAVINIITISSFVAEQNDRYDIRNVALQMNLSTSNNLYE